VKVLAKSASAFLIEFEDGYGRVLDLEQGRLFPPNSVDSILARGYWEPFNGDPSSILDRVGELKDDDPAPVRLPQSPQSGASAATPSRFSL
jgi:hypothetical protein